MPQEKLTKGFVEKQPRAESGQILIWDTELPGFGLRVGTKTKAFFAEAKVNRRTRRVTVGTFPRMTVEVARQEARKVLQDMERGIDPRAKSTATATLCDAYTAFLAHRQLADRTKADYKRYYENYFKPWHSRSLPDITPAAVSKRHLEIGARHGQAQANAAMRFLRSVLYFGQAEYGRDVIPENPVKTLGHKRQWFRELPRQNVLRATDLPEWFKAVLNLKNDKTSRDREAMRDFFLLCLFLGLRRSEALKLRWENVDLKAKTVTIPQTKNYEPKTLPVGPHVLSILKARDETKQDTSWVFHSALDPKKHINDPKKALAEVVKTSKVKHTIHDLRRSFATFLEGLDVSVYASKRLMGHKDRSGDVLGRHYVVTDVERLRPAVEKLENYLLSAAEIKPAAEVTPLKKKRRKG
jgi:integrase